MSETTLRLTQITKLNLSFKTAKDLRNKAERLPKSPAWKSKAWNTKFVHKKKGKLHLFYRDPLECLQELLLSPLIKDHIRFKPFQLFHSAEGAMRVYTEWLSASAAWNIQVGIIKLASSVLTKSDTVV